MARIPGVGLAKGLSITLRHMLRKSVTQQYPEVKPALPPRSRGVIALVEENCTSCMLCARECPDWCIYIDSHKETIPAPEGGRARQRNVLDRFAIDFALCMYCGICIEVCPFDALFWSPEFEYAEGDIRNLLHEKDKLATWTQTVPPPPPHDLGAEPPKELTAAPRRPTPDRPARTTAARPARTTASPAPKEGAKPTPEAPSPESPPPAADPTPGASDTAEPSDTPSTTKAPQPASPPPSSTPGDRPRRPMTNVRGIRPPGALPPQDDPSTPPATNEPAGEDPDTPSSAANEPTGQDPGATPPAANEPAGGDPDVASSAANEPSPGSAADQPPQGQASSTGQPPPGKLSTASDEPRPESEPEEQTSAASPRQRKMADPRSIRPPGRLGPDDTRESEEES